MSISGSPHTPSGESQSRPLSSTTDGTPALPVLTPQEWETRTGGSARRVGHRPRPTAALLQMGRRLVASSAAAAIVISAAILVLHLTHADADAPPANARSAPRTAPVPPDPPDPLVIDEPELVAQEIRPGVAFTQLSLTDATATAGVRSLSLRLKAAVPARVRIRLTGDRVDLRRSILVRPGTRTVRFAALPAGSIRWRALVQGEPAITGHGRVLPTPPRPVTAPDDYAPPPTPTPASAESQPKSEPKPTPEPKPKPKPPPDTRGQQGPPGNGGPRDPDSDGPPDIGPFDPDYP